MNCLESLEILQRRLDGALAPDPALGDHLAQCSICRERHTAARGLLEVLKAAPRSAPAGALTARVLAAVARDRQRRRLRLRRSLYVTAAMAASILIMLAIAYFNRSPQDDKGQPGPIVEQKKDPPSPTPDKKHEPEKHRLDKQEPPATLAALTGKLADKTLDQAKLLLAAANPVEGVPMGEVAKVPVLEPASQPLRQGAHDAGESVQAVSRTARRALDYFTPMFDLSAAETAAHK